VDPLVIVASIALVGILIFVHESGHFLFAKAFGVGVKVFSLGFGRRIWGFERGGTDYRICLLPIGGYVLMEGADPFADDDQVQEELQSKTSLLSAPIYQRLLIVAAGPLFNLALPVVVLAVLFMAGEPRSASVVGTVEFDSPAWDVGIRSGEVISQVNGTPVEFWGELYEVMATLDPGGALELDLTGDRGARQVTFAPDPEGSSWTPRTIGLDDLLSDHTIGVSDPDSPAGKAGLVTFDKVFQVDETKVGTTQQVMDLLGSGGTHVLVVQDAGGSRREVEIRADGSWLPDDPGFMDPLANPWGIVPATLFVKAVSADSAAQEGGIQVGDRLLGIDGRGLGTWAEVTQRIADAQTGEEAEGVDLVLQRDGELISLVLTPRLTRTTNLMGHYITRALIGIERGGGLALGPTARRYYSLVPAVGMAWTETNLLIKLTLGQIGKLVTGQAAPSKTIGGPVQIFRDAGRAARQGIFTWARLMALLSISLGIINFLPVPVLDGGQFLFYAVEGLRGRPVSLRVRERAQQVGVLFLVALMLMVLVFDINRWIAG
jgi:regulator of sigma E protease